MYTAEDMADYELKAALEGFYFDHKVAVRNPDRSQLPYGGMPLLSLAGFTDYLSVEYAADPDLYIGGLNNALRVYSVYPEKGPIPRYLLPATRPHQLQQRIDESAARCSSAAQSRLNAVATQHQLEEQGQRAAINLIPNIRYVYY